MNIPANSWVMVYDAVTKTASQSFCHPWDCNLDPGQANLAIVAATRDDLYAQADALGVVDPDRPVPDNWQAQAAAIGKILDVERASNPAAVPEDAFTALASALSQCSTVPSQYWVVLALAKGLGITQAQIDAAVAVG